MMQMNPKGIISGVLGSVPHVSHAFSSRLHGDMRSEENRRTFAKLLGMNSAVVLKPKQVHGNSVAFINVVPENTIIADVDGLVTNTGLPLAVISADCVPLLAVAPQAKLSGVAHAGWRGTAGNIA